MLNAGDDQLTSSRWNHLEIETERGHIGCYNRNYYLIYPDRAFQLIFIEFFHNESVDINYYFYCVLL